MSKDIKWFWLPGVAASVNGSACISGDGFPATAGSLRLYGPDAADYACEIGASCRVRVEGVGFGDTNAVRLAKTICNEEDVPDDVQAFARVEAPTQATVSNFDLGVPVGEPAVYLLCWHERPAHAEQFFVEVGHLELKGPFQGQEFSCMLGEQCVLTILGVGMKILGE